MLKKISDNLYYLLIWKFVRFLFLKLRRCKIIGMENIPDGIFIIAPNHVSYIDPPLVGSIFNIQIYAMAKKELFAIPILGYVLSKINTFPVDRKSSDVSAIKTAINILKNHGPLLIFPQGTRCKNLSDVNFLKSGIGYLSCLTQRPIVPVYLKNTDAFFSLKPIKVIFGKAIYPPANYSKSDYALLAKKTMEEIKNLSLQN